MIQIRFIGTGGAFDVEQGNSAALVEINGKKILVDCGHSVYPALRRKNLAQEMDYILLTHLHDDHAGSVSTLIFHQYYGAKRRAQLLYPTADFGDHLHAYLAFSQQEPSHYSDFHSLAMFPRLGISYIETTGMHVRNMMTFGYVFEDADERVIYSGDMGNSKLIASYMERNPTSKKVRIFHELTFFPGIEAHCYYKDLEGLAAQYEVYGYHINKDFMPADNKIPLVIDFPELML